MGHRSPDADAICSAIAYAAFKEARGERGYVTPADAADFSRRLPGARVVAVPAGHNVQEEIPVPLGRMLGE